ncbi:hypothetical protein BDQ17DRAFT_1438156 [Cyathus striatus]|nr:hypothetical protein BDQ17DRAFT_1438156 [Cyathus striatus]
MESSMDICPEPSSIATSNPAPPPPYGPTEKVSEKCPISAVQSPKKVPSWPNCHSANAASDPDPFPPLKPSKAKGVQQGDVLSPHSFVRADQDTQEAEFFELNSTDALNSPFVVALCRKTPVPTPAKLATACDAAARSSASQQATGSKMDVDPTTAPPTKGQSSEKAPQAAHSPPNDDPPPSATPAGPLTRPGLTPPPRGGFNALVLQEWVLFALLVASSKAVLNDPTQGLQALIWAGHDHENADHMLQRELIIVELALHGINEPDLLPLTLRNLNSVPELGFTTHRPPTYYLLCNLTSHQLEAISAQPVWNTPEITAFVLPLPFTCTSFCIHLQGLEANEPTTVNINCVLTSIKDTFHTNAAIAIAAHAAHDHLLDVFTNTIYECNVAIAIFLCSLSVNAHRANPIQVMASNGPCPTPTALLQLWKVKKSGSIPFTISPFPLSWALLINYRPLSSGVPHVPIKIILSISAPSLQFQTGTTPLSPVNATPTMEEAQDQDQVEGPGAQVKGKDLDGAPQEKVMGVTNPYMVFSVMSHNVTKSDENLDPG